MVRVDLFCGTRKQDGWIGVDVRPLPGVDVVADLDEDFPFLDASVDELRAIHGPEHARDPVHFMRECWRVLVPGGPFYLEVPSTDGRGAWDNPTHRSWWNPNSFAIWQDDAGEFQYINGGCRFEVMHLESIRGPRKRVTCRVWLRKV